ncbi:MAG: hypothetical protein ACYDGX_04260 [Thermoleophilia bacterium]
MLWSSLKFWRFSALVLFLAVLALAYPHVGPQTHFVLKSSSMEMQSGDRTGALFRYTVQNTGSQGGSVNVNFHAYLYDRGGDTDDDYVTIGVNAGQTKSGEYFMQLRPGQTVHDWRIELT